MTVYGRGGILPAESIIEAPYLLERKHIELIHSAK